MSKKSRKPTPPPEPREPADEQAAAPGAARPAPTEPRKVRETAPASQAELERKIAELEDKYRRAMADLANLHKRFQRERERLTRRAVADFVEKLLPMIDNMAHSLKSAEESHDAAALIEGFRLIETQTLQILADTGVTPIKTVGRPFDPEVHHAVTTEVTDAVPPGTVTEELGRGFKLGDYVVRPAQVKVAAAPPREEPAPEPDNRKEAN